jgi:hypothetical protein
MISDPYGQKNRNVIVGTKYAQLVAKGEFKLDDDPYGYW